MASLLITIENAIIARLKQYVLSRIKIAGYPDNPDKIGLPLGYGQILVGYKSSTFKATSFNPAGVQQLMEFDLQLQLKELRTHQGIYGFLDFCRAVLTGFIPPGATGGMMPNAEGFIDSTDGIWFYTQSYTVPVMFVPGDLTSLNLEDYVPYPPIPLTPLPTDIPITITAGLYRSRVNRLVDNVLDQEIKLDIQVE